MNALPEPTPPNDPLAGLMVRIARRDEEALGRLYDATSAQIHGVALRLLREPGAAEEATLDVFLQVWSKAGEYDPGRGTVAAWLLMLARTRSIDTLRSRTRRSAREMPLPPVDNVLDPAPGPEQNARQSQTAARVRDLLAVLSADQRTAVEAAYFGGLTHSEVAEALGIPLGTAKTRIRDGLTALRRELGRRGGADPREAYPREARQ